MLNADEEKAGLFAIHRHYGYWQRLAVEKPPREPEKTAPARPAKKRSLAEASQDSTPAKPTPAKVSPAKATPPKPTPKKADVVKKKLFAPSPREEKSLNSSTLLKASNLV